MVIINWLFFQSVEGVHCLQPQTFHWRGSGRTGFVTAVHKGPAKILCVGPKIPSSECFCGGFFSSWSCSKGIFLSQCKDTGKLDSLAILSKPPATDKNLFYISTFAWAVETFQRSVDPDFTLEDGLTLCVAMTCVGNAELIVYALVSGTSRRRWACRHSSCLGALGLLFEVGRQRNGGVHNVGSGCTKRTQPWINTRMLDSAKYRRLIDITVELCTQGRHAKPNTEPTQEGYETTLRNLQVALQGQLEKQPMLCMQHYLHLIHKLGYLKMPGLHRFASINHKNSNSAYIDSYLSVGSGKQCRQLKLEQMLSQTKTYFREVFDTDFNSNQGQNATCVCHKKEERFKSGEAQKPPIPATDMVFPGQGFLEHRKDSQQYYLTKTGIRWDDSKATTVIKLNTMGPWLLIP
jgi:hypothetical protein